MLGWLQILTLPGESMTGCLDELMDKANEMGLDECWDDVSDEDKAVLEPMFRLHLFYTIQVGEVPVDCRGCSIDSLKVAFEKSTLLRDC